MRLSNLARSAALRRIACTGAKSDIQSRLDTKPVYSRPVRRDLFRVAKVSPGNKRLLRPVSIHASRFGSAGATAMSQFTRNDGDGRVSRRKVLECMTWAGTGVLWTISGGVPRSLGIIDQALAAEPSKLTFLQISDSHVGFDKPANPNATGTLREAIAKIKALPAKPSFLIHTGDITHLSKP